MSIDAFSKPKSGIGGFLSTSNSSNNEKLSAELQKSSDFAKGDTAKLKSKTETPRLVEANRIGVVLSIATDAVSRIADLREEQKALATRAKKSGDPVERERLADEFSSISTEISRITSNLTVYGENVADGTQLDILREQEDISSINGSANILSLSQSVSGTFTSQTSAETTESELDELLHVTYTARGNISDKRDENSRLISKYSVDQAASLAEEEQIKITTETSINKIMDLAEEIALDLQIKAGEEQDSPIDPLHKLEPSKVAKLLSDF